VHDDRRIDYLREHLAAVAQARDTGVPVDGYFVWSLLDNLEWVSGFSQRFGLVWVDHESQERVIKDSGHWYADVVASRQLGG
jgi:beta-glucosidase